jgi:hypothetical protein
VSPITRETSPRAVARALDRLGVEYAPADLSVRNIRLADDMPQEIQLECGPGTDSGPLLHRGDDGWTYELPGCRPCRLVDPSQLPLIARACQAARYLHEQECLPDAARLAAATWALAWGREWFEAAEQAADELERDLERAGCAAIKWYDGLVCWRTADGDAGHLQLTRVATYGE